MNRLMPEVGAAACAGLVWVLLLVLSAHFARADTAASVGYTISLSSPEQHLVEVQIILPARRCPA